MLVRWGTNELLHTEARGQLVWRFKCDMGVRDSFHMYLLVFGIDRWMMSYAPRLVQGKVLSLGIHWCNLDLSVKSETDSLHIYT